MASMSASVPSLPIPRTPFWANSELVCILSHMDRIDEAEEALVELYRKKPDYSCKYYVENYPTRAFST